MLHAANIAADETPAFDNSTRLRTVVKVSSVRTQRLSTKCWASNAGVDGGRAEARLPQARDGAAPRPQPGRQGGGDAFKEASEAYQVLSDPEKRARLRSLRPRRPGRRRRRRLPRRRRHLLGVLGHLRRHLRRRGRRSRPGARRRHRDARLDDARRGVHRRHEGGQGAAPRRLHRLRRHGRGARHRARDLPAVRRARVRSCTRRAS